MDAVQTGFWVLALLVALAVAFDFMNGFHDAANSIATVVSTRVLKPQQAVFFAAAFNVIAIAVFHLKVAATIGKGIVDPGVVDAHVVFGALIGAIVWNLITWWYGIPASSSHALIGGILGATIAKAGAGSLIGAGIAKTVLFIFVSPALVPPPAADFGRAVLARPRRQRRAKDDRHHLAAADRLGARRRCRSAAAGLGDLGLLYGDGAGHPVRGLAHRQDDG